MTRRFARQLRWASLIVVAGVVVLCSATSIGQAFEGRIAGHLAGLMAPVDIGFAQQRMMWWQ